MELGEGREEGEEEGRNVGYECIWKMKKKVLQKLLWIGVWGEEYAIHLLAKKTKKKKSVALVYGIAANRKKQSRPRWN